jgi:5'-nucleotidase
VSDDAMTGREASGAGDGRLGGRVVVESETRPGDEQSRPARVLVTNDDGVESPGIARLALALAEHFAVTVAAPDRDWSGSGTGIGRFDPAAGVPMRRADIGIDEAYALDGPPGLAVLAAALGAFGDPFDVVVSGVNAGINTGQSVIHSGTVGAALTARTFGSHGVAISTPPADPWHWDTAAALAVAVTHWILASDQPATAVNVNAPARPIDEVRGLRAAELDRFGYFRVAAAGEGRLEFEVMSDGDEPSAGCDTALVREGWATITVLGRLVDAPSVLPDDLSTIWSPDRR